MYPDRKTAEALLAELSPTTPAPGATTAALQPAAPRPSPAPAGWTQTMPMCWGCSTTSGGGTASGTSAML